MDEPTAMARIESMVAASSAPALDSGQLDELLVIARRPDSNGLLPSDENWAGAYDLNAAAAEGWRWKAAKVAGEFGFSSDGQSFNREQAHAACIAMAEHYAKRVTGSIPLNPPVSIWDTDVAGNVNV